MVRLCCVILRLSGSISANVFYDTNELESGLREAKLTHMLLNTHNCEEWTIFLQGYLLQENRLCSGFFKKKWFWPTNLKFIGNHFGYDTALVLLSNIHH